MKICLNVWTLAWRKITSTFGHPIQKTLALRVSTFPLLAKYYASLDIFPDISARSFEEKFWAVLTQKVPSLFGHFLLWNLSFFSRQKRLQDSWKLSPNVESCERITSQKIGSLATLLFEPGPPSSLILFIELLKVEEERLQPLSNTTLVVQFSLQTWQPFSLLL